MKISIITVVFNSANTIKHAIDSVLYQTYKNVEYIIVDGMSSDGTIDIINSYGSKISRFISEEDNGLYDAMNKGISMSTGDIVGFLNSDDFYINEKVIESIMIQFNKNNSLEVLYGNILYVDRYDITRVVRRWESKSYYDSYFEHGNVPAHPALYLSKKIFSIVGNFNTDLKFASDYEFMLRLFKLHKFKFYYLDMNFVCMRLGGKTSGGLKSRISQNIEIYRSWKINNLNLPLLLFPYRIINKIKQYF